MSMPLYAPPEQLMRERSELARKGISRGRSVVAMSYAGGVLFVAENPSSTLHKVSEIYDRIGFAAAGRYSEYESLRRGGIKHVDLWGYAYDRRDVSARQLANVYAQTLAGIFTEQIKPFEVEICVAQVGPSFGTDELYRLTFDGSINDEPRYLVMGGQADAIATALKDLYRDSMDLDQALDTAVTALRASANTGATNGAGPAKKEQAKSPAPELNKLEVAVLDRSREHRTFRRIAGAALTALLSSRQADGEPASAEPEPDEPAAPSDDSAQDSDDKDGGDEDGSASN
ncbi:MAG: proteasome subunit alpha [Sciscionella sp.]